jgi:hypothetical protein
MYEHRCNNYLCLDRVFQRPLQQTEFWKWQTSILSEAYDMAEALLPSSKPSINQKLSAQGSERCAHSTY